MNPLILKMVLEGERQLQSGLNNSATATKNLGSASGALATHLQKVQDAGRKIGDGVKRGTDESKRALDDLQSEAKSTLTAVENIGDSGAKIGDGVKRGSESAKQVLEDLENQAKQTKKAIDDAASGGSGARPRDASGRFLPKGSVGVPQKVQPTAQPMVLPGATSGLLPSIGERARFAKNSAEASFGGEKNASALSEFGSGATQAGMTMGAAGAGGALLLGKAVMNADEMARTRKSLSFSLGGDAQADSAIAKLQGIDRSSPFDFQETTKMFSSLLGKGFSEADSFKYLTTTGDAVARTGGTTDNLAAIMRQLGQGKSKDKFERQDLDVMAEAGGLPIFQILKEGLSQERYQQAMSGEKVLSADEFFSAFDKGMQKYKGGMAEANNSLTGQLSNLSSALYQLGASIGQYLLPPVTALIGFTTAVADFFNGMPGPLQAIVAYGGAALTGILILGGGLLMLMGTLASSAVSMLTLAGMMGIGTAATATNTAALGVNAAASGTAAISTGLFSISLLSVIAALALVAIAVAGFYVAVKGTADASTMSAAKLQEHWGALGSFWVSAGDALSAVWDHPLLAWLHGGNKAAGDDADRKNYELYKKGEEKKGRKAKSFEEYVGDVNGDEYKADPKPDPAKTAATVPTASAPAMPVVMPIPPMGSTSGAAAAVPTMPPAGGISSGATAAPALGNFAAPATTDIEALEDQVAQSAKGYKPNSAKEQLRQARRAERHAKAEEREEKREKREQEREARKAKRDAEREAKAARREADDLAKDNAEIAEAELNSQLKIQIDKAKAGGASKGQINRIKAQAELKRGQIRARGQGSDKRDANKALRIAEAKAAGLTESAQYADSIGSGNGKGKGKGEKQELGSMLNYLRSGGSLYNLTKRKSTGGAAGAQGDKPYVASSEEDAFFADIDKRNGLPHAKGSGAAFTMADGSIVNADGSAANSASSGSGTSDERTFNVQPSSKTYNSTSHKWVFKFADIEVSDPYAKDAGML